MREKSDEDLMELYISGDSVAFDELYKRYAPRVYGLIRKYVQNEEKGNDLFQNAFLRIHSQRLKFKGGYLVAPWILVITKNIVIDFLRKNQKEKITDMDLDQLPAKKAEKEMDEEINWGALKIEQKEALQMRYFNESSFTEIAEALKTTQENARQLVSRAIKKLRGKV